VLISGAIGRRVTERAPLSRSGGHPHSFLENTYLLESEAYAPIEQLILNQLPNGLRTYRSNVSEAIACAGYRAVGAGHHRISFDVVKLAIGKSADPDLANVDLTLEYSPECMISLCHTVWRVR
jgi:hypothetical protein